MSRQMKDSGIPWIGEIPEHWQLFLTSTLFHEHKEKNNGLKNTNLLSLSYGKIKRKDINTNEGLLPQSFETYNVIAKDDIVFRLTDLQNDKRSLRTGLCLEDGIITSAYLTLRKNTDLNSSFFHYLYHVYDLCKVFYGLGDGVRQGMNYDDIRRIIVFSPPLEEQQRIADFLDQKCGEVDEMVSLQEKIIEELKAYKQAIITEAVCKGLNPDVEMKDSGVEWIGKIPEGWEVIKVKYLANSFSKGNGITKEEVFADGDTPCVRYGEIYSKYDYSFSECVSFTKKDALSSLHYFHKGDILFAGTGELVEEIGKNIVYLGDSPCLAGGDIIILNHNQNPLFLNFALNSYAQIQKSKGKAKLKVVHISASEIGSLYIALPPLSEQQQIAKYLDQKCAEINSLVAIKQQKIEELKDYKKSIIYEYITGKKEVAK